MGSKASQQIIKHILSIDPGTRNVGWAIFGILKNNSVVFVDSGFVHVPSKEETWIPRIDEICIQILNVYWHHHIQTARVLIELPAVFVGSHKGRAASNSGAVGKILACVFQLKGVLSREFPSWEIDLIPVRTWKGNLPKERTEYRIQKYWGVKGKTNDESDAIGIADWHIRKILKYRPPIRRK